MHVHYHWIPMCFLLLAQLSGCTTNQTDNPTPKATGQGIELKDLSREDFINLMKNPWQTLSENGKEITGRPFLIEADASETQFLWVEVQDSVVRTKITAINRKEHGYEIVRETPLGTSALWFTRWGNDTLYYTSPEYPPRNVHTAGSYNAPDFEADIREVYCKRFLQNILCQTETVPGKPNEITGQWKLMKDLVTDTDLSCNEIIYDFQADHQLRITGHTNEYPSGNHTYTFSDYPFCSLCLCPACPPNLIIDATTGVYCEVLKRTMILYAPGKETLRGEPGKILVRI
ncbi:MAG: hypothetical protein LBD89_03575 [Tannerellaceae bacterium]|jgi:hypothetical protein|nr:hypothetical protein [Tannerellaceae bacterium]